MFIVHERYPNGQSGELGMYGISTYSIRIRVDWTSGLRFTVCTTVCTYRCGCLYVDRGRRMNKYMANNNIQCFGIYIRSYKHNKIGLQEIKLYF